MMTFVFAEGLLREAVRRERADAEGASLLREVADAVFRSPAHAAKACAPFEARVTALDLQGEAETCWKALLAAKE